MTSPWKKYTLLAAGAYNLVWGSLVIAFPLALFQWLNIPLPVYPELWQCIGMIVGVYGVGYVIAAFDPDRHWPIVLVGFLGKLLGPIGFVHAAMQGHFPWAMGWVNVTNDLIWLVPFALILKGAHDAALGQKRVTSREIIRMALRARTQDGMSLEELTKQWPTLIVFLRHTGCTFCRETLADVAKQRDVLQRQGVRIVFVHMGSEEDSRPIFNRYGLGDISRVSDANQSVYRAFGLNRGGLGSLFGPKVWWRGFQAGILDRHGIGRLAGDGFQMPGVFLLFHGEVIRSYRHQSAADRPDYLQLAAPVGVTEVV